jgi:adenosylcobyric acid synthase
VAEYVTDPPPGAVDCIILPGTKNTISDLEWLRARGLDRWILEQNDGGAAVWGICGGYQMLGRRIADPLGVESEAREAEGLGLIDCETVLAGEKATRVVEAQSAASGRPFRAYEIHMGQTNRPRGCAFALVDGRPEGYRENGIIGTYLHGALEDAGLLEELLAEVAARRGKPALVVAAGMPKEAVYDRLAGWFEQHADVWLFEELYLR